MDKKISNIFLNFCDWTTCTLGLFIRHEKFAFCQTVKKWDHTFSKMDIFLSGIYLLYITYYYKSVKVLCSWKVIKIKLLNIHINYFKNLQFIMQKKKKNNNVFH